MSSAEKSTPTAVLGAAGQQGGAVVDALLAAGQEVRAVVRDPNSERSAALAERGVEIVVGDQDDPDSLCAPLPMPGDVALQMVAVRDIGAVAAAALLDPGALGGATLEIAGDEVTGEQAAATIGRHLGKPARYEQVPSDAFDDDRAAMFRWFVDTTAYEPDFARTRAVDPGVLDLAGWLAGPAVTLA